jgi:D-3-phosphoglycerate dehydrogenase
MGSLSLDDVLAVLRGAEPAHPVPVPASAPEETR